MLLVISCPRQHLPPLLLSSSQTELQFSATSPAQLGTCLPSAWHTFCLHTSPCPSVRRLVRDSTSSEKCSLTLLSRPRPGHTLTLRLPSQACLLPPSCFQTRPPHPIHPTRTVTPDSKACAHLLSLCPPTAPGTEQVLHKYCLTNVQPAPSQWSPQEVNSTPLAREPRKKC